MILRMSLSPARLQALDEARAHTKLVRLRLEVAERIFAKHRPTDEDLAVAAHALEDAISCVAVAYEETDRTRYLP